VRHAVIVEAVRTAHGKHNGMLSPVHPVDLAATTLASLVDRTGIDPGTVDGGVETMSRVPLGAARATGMPYGPKVMERYVNPRLLNPLGGAIALGHPLGASGASLMTRLVRHMRDNGIRCSLQTVCEGGGTANATIVELAA
jgi:acetyl-CoA acetyltransferase